MKIYVICAYSRTGGTKTLHQMANKIQNIGHEVYIVYYSNYEIFKSHQLLYDWCLCQSTDNIEDISENIIIAPESMTYALVPYSRLRKVIFWLSLDFYFWTIPHDKVVEKMRLYSYPRFLYPFAYLHLRDTFVKKEIVSVSEFSGLYHLYNCEYIRRFLLNHGVSNLNMHYLCGPIEDTFSNKSKETLIDNKKDIISYNTNKDKVIMKQLNEVLKHIRTRRTDIKLIPIEKMSREEVENTLSASKLFLDLGSFPGPERIPREAVLAYANLLVMDNGAAANEVDYPIPKSYKLSHLSNEEIAIRAIEMVEHYQSYIDDFNNFRHKVIKQRTDFENDIGEIFSQDNGSIVRYVRRNKYCID